MSNSAAKLRLAIFGLCCCLLPRPVFAQSDADRLPAGVVNIPGPLHSFLRIAGMSQEASSSDVLSFLARKVFQEGRAGTAPTEYLLLVQRYVRQARELEALAGPDKTIRVTGCDSAAALLHVLGYKLRGGCGEAMSFETADPERAFLTTDSGFPLTDLEEALQHGTSFSDPYASSPIPVLFSAGDWMALGAAEKLRFNSGLDLLLDDAPTARLYWALSRMDGETRSYLQRTVGLKALLAVAPTLDFYGSQLSIREGKVHVPGGANAEAAWTALVGASPSSPVNFVGHLLVRDHGWLAAYFDVLSRLDGKQQDHFTAGDRLRQFYDALRSVDPRENASAGVVPPTAELLVLVTRQVWESDGAPHLPGNTEVWQRILHRASEGSNLRAWRERASSLDRPDQFLGAMFAFSRVEADAGPLQLYLTLSELDRRRSSQRQLTPATVDLLSDHFASLSHWYLIFSEFPELGDRSMIRFVQTAEALDTLRDGAVRANALGAFQANVGMWQILARQQEIPTPELDNSWMALLAPFTGVASSTQLFDAARSSLESLLAASNAGGSGAPAEVIDRLAGPAQATEAGRRMHDELAARMRSVLDDQRLVALETLFALNDGLEDMARTGKKGSEDLLALARELHEFDLPRPIFTNREKAYWAPTVYVSHHAELQVQTDLSRVIKGPSTHAQLEAARGQLTPFLRDTLVGLNYAYYEPPGAQILHVNSLFVRAHDFLGVSIIASNRVWQPPILLGAGVSAGGGAYLMGSLADLPYALAQAEQDFIVPDRVQALIWRELIPGFMAAAVFPRWWNVSAAELHAVALYQKAGEELTSRSAKDAEVRGEVLEILSDHLAPKRLEEFQRNVLTTASSAPVVSNLMSSETFYLAEEFRTRHPNQTAAMGAAGTELEELANTSPAAVDANRLSEDFGVPHPTMARTNARELLHVEPFPLSVGNTSRLFGESLESTNLYWARLADEMGYPPVYLHRLVPELTRYMAGKIFATNIEDWPAVLRAMQGTRDDLRGGKIGALRGIPGGAVVQAASSGAAR